MIFTAIGSSCIDIYYDVDKLPNRGDKVIRKLDGKFVGGMIANAASVLAGYGEEVYIVDYLNDDYESELLLNDLKSYNVHVDAVEVSKKYENGHCLIIKDKTGERNILVVPGENNPYILNDVQLKIIEKSDYIYTTISDLKKIKNLDGLLDMISNFNTKLVLDIEPSTIREESDFLIVNEADLVFINEHALKIIDEIYGFENLKKNIGHIVLTLGENGSKTIFNDRVFNHEAIKVNVVDTTGAGDVYNASYLYALSKNMPIEECGKFASVAASEKIKKMGARSGVRRAEEIFKLMKGNVI